MLVSVLSPEGRAGGHGCAGSAALEGWVREAWRRSASGGHEGAVPVDSSDEGQERGRVLPGPCRLCSAHCRFVSRETFITKRLLFSPSECLCVLTSPFTDTYCAPTQLEKHYCCRPNCVPQN